MQSIIEMLQIKFVVNYCLRPKSTFCNYHAVESSKEWQPKGRLQIISALYLQLSQQGEFQQLVSTIICLIITIHNLCSTI